MIKLTEILSGITTRFLPRQGGFNIVAYHNDKEVGKLQIGWSSRDPSSAFVLAADAEPQRQGIGTLLYEQAKEELKNHNIEWLVGAVEGSGIVQIREKVFGKGNNHYYSGGQEISTEDAIHIMDVEFGRVLAKTRIV